MAKSNGGNKGGGNQGSSKPREGTRENLGAGSTRGSRSEDRPSNPKK